MILLACLIHPDNVWYRSYCNCSETENNGAEARVCGSLSGSYAYNDIQSVNIPYNLDTSRSKEAVLTFADGGITTDAKVTSYSKGSSCSVSYEHVQREYNGRTEIFKEYGTLRLNVTNNYPFGFVLYDEDRDVYCYYQDYSED